MKHYQGPQAISGRAEILIWEVTMVVSHLYQSRFTHYMEHHGREGINNIRATEWGGEL